MHIGTVHFFTGPEDKIEIRFGQDEATLWEYGLVISDGISDTIICLHKHQAEKLLKQMEEIVRKHKNV